MYLAQTGGLRMGSEQPFLPLLGLWMQLPAPYHFPLYLSVMVI